MCDLFKCIEKDERYTHYNYENSYNLWGKSMDSRDINIYVSNVLELDGNIENLIESYLSYLSLSGNVLIDYMKCVVEETLPDNWLDNLEVIFIDVTFLDKDDYGATIIFGEEMYLDHCIEVYFEKKK